eukprot:NODE_494_length_7750_cov_0.325317.p3 type:complete len:250 gc:universal NODE_494_length_7750_cov_0.325317:6821-6072(-)
MNDEYEIIEKENALKPSLNSDKTHGSPKFQDAINSDKTYLVNQDNIKLTQLELLLHDTNSKLQERLSKQSIKIQLQESEIERQKAANKKVMNMLNDQKQQLYGINAFVEDCFNDLQAKFAIEKSIYDSNMGKLNSEIEEMKSALFKIESLLILKQAKKSTEFSDKKQRYIKDEKNLIDLEGRTICVKTVHDQEFQLPVGNFSRILEVKESIFNILSIPIQNQILVGNGKVCENHDKIDDKDLLYLIVSK